METFRFLAASHPTRPALSVHLKPRLNCRLMPSAMKANQIIRRCEEPKVQIRRPLRERRILGSQLTHIHSLHRDLLERCSAAPASLFQRA
jgi:hypothetical protein